MKRILRICALLISCVYLIACASNARVQSSHDDSVDFNQFETYNFSSRTAIENPDLPGTLELLFSAAVEQQLLLRGLARSDKPDILINVSVGLEENSSAPRNSENGNCPRYQDYYSRSPADPYSGEGRRPMCIYTEGEINVVMVEVGSNQTLWKGISRVRFDENDVSDKLVRYVQNDVATMFGDSTAKNLASVPNPIHPYNPNSASRGVMTTLPKGDG